MFERAIVDTLSLVVPSFYFISQNGVCKRKPVHIRTQTFNVVMQALAYTVRALLMRQKKKLCNKSYICNL